ncbi:MAG: hypothetical protein KUG77_12390 [Nannocystaceae bacterium]|nr:hypothetical protein [Nannocystaceae bacterium]
MSKNHSRGAGLAALLIGCGPAVATNDSGDSDASTDSSQTTSGLPGTASTPTTSTPVTSATVGTDTGSPDPPPTGSTLSDASSSSTSQRSSGFAGDPDGGVADIDCYVWEDGCPLGEACRPWSSDGSHSWNRTRCISISDTPDLVGEPCTTESSPLSGLDTCEPRSMCFDVDPDTLQGTCIAYCDGTPDAPVCADPTTTCVIGNDDMIALCLSTCDPLQQNCANEEMCTGNLGESAFFCMPSGTPYINEAQVQPAACDVGQVGVVPDLVDECLEGEPCCTTFCDLTVADSCDAGLDCLPWTPDGSCLGFCDEGLCVSPS